MTVFAQHTLAVNHKRRRQAPDSAETGELGLALVGGQKTEILRHFFDRHQVLGRVHADGNHLQTRGLVFAVIRFDGRHFRLTRRAPGGPEVHDDDFAFMFRQAKYAALMEVCGFKVGNGFTYRQGLRRQTDAGQSCPDRNHKIQIKTLHAASLGWPVSRCRLRFVQNLCFAVTSASRQCRQLDLPYSAGRRPDAASFVSNQT